MPRTVTLHDWLNDNFLNWGTPDPAFAGGDWVTDFPERRVDIGTGTPVSAGGPGNANVTSSVAATASFLNASNTERFAPSDGVTPSLSSAADSPSAGAAASPSGQAVPGRADFGIGTAVRTGIGNTSGIGTTGDFVNQDINGVLSGSAWNVTNITFSFPTSGSFYGNSSTYPDPAPFNDFQVLSAAQQNVVRYAVGLISQYTGLTFTEITETASVHANIRLAGSSSPSTSYAYTPANTATGGDVFYGNIRNSAPTKAGYEFDTILHEIGHAVGLKHGQDDDGTHGVLPTAHDSTSWSIMDYHSYIGADGFYRNSQGSGNQSYMSDDIAALQYLYGANFNTNSGNTVYSWSTTTGQEFINGVGQGASSTNTIYESIWDGNGIDTYDLSNYSTNLSVNLNPGEWSTFSTAQLANLDSSNPGVHLAPGNISNANEFGGVDTRSLIENAYGGSGNDVLIGNAANNVLRGNAGNDDITGGAGIDTAWYSGVAGSYVVSLISGDNYSITGPDGTDQLHGIEMLQFGNSPAIPITSADDYAGNTSTTGTLAPGGSVNATINFGGDQDWFRTTLTAGTIYWFDDEGTPTGQGTLTDPYLRLLSNDGATLVMSNNDGGVGFNAFLAYTPTVTGTYYVSAQGLGSATGTYRLSEVVADDMAGNPGTTRNLAIGGGTRGTTDFAGDTDWIRVALTTGTTYWFNDEGSPTAQGTLPDTFLRLYGADDGVTAIASNDDGGVGLNSSISYTPTVTGTYYLSAEAFGSNTGSYRVSAQVADDFAGNPSTTGALAPGGAVNATIDFIGDQDWFATTLTAGTTYWFNQEGSPTGQGTLTDSFLRLLSNDGATLVATNDDGGVGLNSFLAYTPTATGTYYLSAQGFGSNTGTYRVSEQVADDVPGNPSTGLNLPVGGTTTATINFAGDTDWMRIALTAGTTYWFNEEGTPTGQGTLADTFLRLYGADDGVTAIASNDDGGVGLNSSISYTPTVSGSYYLSAQAFGSNTGTYRLSAVAADDFANNPSTTGAIGLGGAIGGSIDFAGDQDWFATTLTAGTSYSFDEEGSPTGQGTLPDTFLRLFANDGATLLSSDDDSGVGLNSHISLTVSVSGTYYVSAGAFGSNTGTYHLFESAPGPGLQPSGPGPMSFIGGSTAVPAANNAGSNSAAGNPDLSALLTGLRAGSVTSSDLLPGAGHLTSDGNDGVVAPAGLSQSLHNLQSPPMFAASNGQHFG